MYIVEVHHRDDLQKTPLQWVFRVFLAVPLASGQVHSSTSWVCHLLTECLTELLTESVTKLKISVNIDAGTLNLALSIPGHID